MTKPFVVFLDKQYYRVLSKHHHSYCEFSWLSANLLRLVARLLRTLRMPPDEHVRHVSREIPVCMVEGQPSATSNIAIFL
jgi:hypothetical protein